MNFKKYSFNLLLIALFTSCGHDKVDTTKVKEEMDKYKIKKISPGEILSSGEEIGVSLANKLQKDLSKKLDSALSNGGIKVAMPFCIYTNNPIHAELEKKNDAKILRAGFPERLRNPLNKPDSNQAMVLEGYSYAMRKGLSLKTDVFDNNSQLVVNSPILITNSCLPCHGSIYQDITESNYQEISARYPNDKSTGFKVNEPIGVWTVILDKAFVIQNMESNKK